MNSKASETVALSPAEEPPAAPGDRPSPDGPLVIIEPSKSWVALDLRDLWTYRELLYFLVWRDVKVRYKQTILGAAWAIIQPLFTMVIFTLLFGRLAGIKFEGVPYALSAYAGLLPWTFFSNAVTASGNSLVGNANLITKVYFPRIVIPAAAVFAGLVDLFFAFLTLIALMIYYRVSPSLNLLALPALVMLTSTLALAVGMWMSALNVKYRDVRYALPFLIQLWMFASPIIYPSSMVPAKWRWLISLNPLTGIIEGYRSSLFNLAFDWRALAVSSLLTLLALVYSLFTFKRMERRFADII
ncbi:MAG TPA: ABC transporter permease [Pyrinomonadaceae bacterium]|nr:ABC transporter permease [Pyrinomonadaceae bacterium]